MLAIILRSVAAVQDKLTAEEQDRILVALENAKEGREMAEAAHARLRRALAALEKVAGVIEQARMRP